MMLKSLLIVVAFQFQCLLPGVLVPSDEVRNDKESPPLVPTAAVAVFDSDSWLCAVCLINEHTFGVSTYDSVSIWEVGESGNGVRCIASAGIRGVLDLHYLPDNNTLLCASDGLFAWNLERREIGLLGGVIPVDSPETIGSSDFNAIVATRDNQWVVGCSQFPVIARVDDLKSAKAQTMGTPFGAVAWRKDGSELFLLEEQNTESEAIVLRHLSELTLGPPVARFRLTTNHRTREVVSDPAIQTSAVDLPVRSGVYWENGLKTATDGDRIYLSLTSQSLGKDGRRDDIVPIHELWDVSDQNRCKLISWFTDRDLGVEYEKRGALVKSFAVDAKDAEHSGAHFIYIFSGGLIDVTAVPNAVGTRVVRSDFLPFQKAKPEVGKVCSAAVSRDGRQIITGHNSGYVMMWQYSPIRRE